LVAVHCNDAAAASKRRPDSANRELRRAPGAFFSSYGGLRLDDDAFEAPRFHTITANVFPRELESHLIIGRCKFDVLAVSANNDSILIHGLAPPPDARQAQVTRKSVASALTLLCSNIEGRDRRSI
jgi:hypothetical protein